MYLDRKDRTLITPEQKQLVEARWELQKSRVPDLFRWVSDSFVGCTVTPQNGDLEKGEWPSISLTGPRSRWAPVMDANPGYRLSESSEIRLEMKGSEPNIQILKKLKVRKGNVIHDEGVRAYRLDTSQIHCSSLSLVEFVAKQLETAHLLNPGGGEIDLEPFKTKLKELSTS